MRMVLLSLFLALAAGCSTSPVAFDEAKPVPSDRIFAFSNKPETPFGTIVVARDTGFVSGGCFVAIHIDGKVVARIDTGEVVSLYLPVGDHLVGLGVDKQGGGMCSWTDSLKEQSASLVEGQSKRFRIGGDTQVGLDIRPSSI